MRESRSDSWQSINQKWIASASPRNDGIRFAPKFYFILGIIFNLCLLAFFKYTDFLLENFNVFSKLAHLDFSIPLPHILLPLALSFVTFQQIAFLFDCYKHTKGELDENLYIDFIDYALFISFFPQLIAGPIVHHREMMPQFAKMGANSACGDFSRSASAHFVNGRPSPISSFASHNHENSHTILEFVSCNGIIKNDKNNPSLRGESMDSPKQSTANSKIFDEIVPQRKSANEAHLGVRRSEADLSCGAISQKAEFANYEYLAKGIFIFSIGLFKKAFIADSFAKWANAGFSVVESGGFLNIAESWATSLSYTFQLYFDFSGYCDMAIGLALMFGIVLPLNFDSPYKSLNIAEFWRRWHITLGRFLKECVYIPLGGNRVSKILNLRNLFIVAFLSGVWHGAGWGFVIWGILHGVAMMIHRIYAWWLANSSFCDKSCRHTDPEQSEGEVSKSRDSNQIKDAMSQKRIDESRKFTQSKKIANDSKVAKMDSSLHASRSAQNDKKLIFTHTRLYKFLCWFITFNFVNLTWIFFRSENLNGAVNLIKGMFGFANLEIPHKWSKIFSTLQGGTNEIIIWIVCAFVVCLIFKNSNQITQKIKISHCIIAGFMFALLIFTMLSSTTYKAPFLYFNF